MEHHPLEHQDFRSRISNRRDWFHAGRNVGAERGGHSLFQLRQRAALAGPLSKHQKDVRIGEYYQTRYDLGTAELKDYLDALSTADNSMLSALEAKIPDHPVREPDLQSDGRALRTHLAVWRKGYTGEHVHQWRKHMFQVKINKAPFGT